MKQNYFDNVKAYRLFKAKLQQGNERQRLSMWKSVFDLYKEKQLSPLDLPTFRLTVEDIETLTAEVLIR